jgi:class 3 adenylate cyclase/ligand-binding sensor domain-containing protein
MKNRVDLLILFLLASFLPHQLGAQELPFRHFTTDNEINPLPGSAITAVFQDQTGYIWFAVYGTGVVRYDGHQMEVFTPMDGASTYIFSIKQDGKGRLWLAGAEGISLSEHALIGYDPGEKINFTTQIDDLTLPGTRLVHREQLYIDDHENIWTTTFKEIIRYHYENDEKLVADTISLSMLPEKLRSVFCFSSLPDGKICAVTESQHMLFLAPESLSVDTMLFDLTSDVTGMAATHNLLLDRSGTLWGSRNNGEIWKLAPGESDFKPSVTTMVNGLAIKSILETKEGHFLAASLGGGLIEFDVRDLEHPITYTQKNGMLSPVIWDLMQDREGNIWIATNSGLSRLPGDYKAFGHYTTNSAEGAPNMLPESGVIAIMPEMQWKDGEKPLLVAGTGGGISFIRNGNERQILKVEDGLLDNAVLDLSQDQKGRVWIAGRKGITCLSKDPNLLKLPGFEAYTSMSLFGEPMYISKMPFVHMNGAVITHLSRSEQDTEKVETVMLLSGSSVLFFADEQFYYLPPELCLQRRGFRSIALDGRGYLYVGDQAQGMLRSRFPFTIEKLNSLAYTLSKNPRYSGIRSLNEPIFVPHLLTAGADTIAMVSSFLWLDSVMWMGTERGILVLSGDSLESHTNLTDKDGLKANGAVGFLYDRRLSLLWASTNNGIVGIDPISKKIRRTVEKKDGLVDDHAWGFPSLEISRDGTLYFGTAQGLSIYDPLLDEPDSIAPTVALREFQLIENKGENNILEIEYAALSYTYEQGISYQTRLVGFDPDWTEDTKDTRIRYTNLPALWVPKTYYFELRAQDESGNVMENPLSFAFDIKPRWYLTWWAFIGYLLLLAALVYSYVRWRTAALKRRQRQLEATVTERTAEIVQQKDIILKEKERSEELLLNILPAEVAEELKLNGSSPARTFDEVTVLFTDIKEFTNISEQLTATELVAEINICFQAFDEITSKYDIEKIKTIGDAYLAAGGLHIPRKTEPGNVVLAALEMQKFVQQRRKQNQERGALGFEMRCGIHTGPVVAGIVGIKKFQYDIWGDTVNTAARMESGGEVGQVNISESTYQLLANDPQFTFVNRGKIDVKNKGEIQMYYVDEKR